jgi:transcriptional regulator of arginine metabolism
MPLPSDLILSVEASANLAVVRTPPGGAQFLASALDNSGINGIIGTIAGDDTVLVVSKKSNGGAELAKELLSFSRSSNKSSSNGKSRK